jgi:type I restriction enzyme S subunit
VNAYAAVQRALKDRWPTAEFRRLTSPVESPRGDRNFSLLSLSSAGRLAVRGADARQQPTDEYAERYWCVRPGQLVVNPMWLIGGGIGVSELTGAVSPDYRVYQLDDELAPRFIHHLLRSAPYRDQYRLLVRAETTFDRRITKDDFGALPIPRPPLSVQRAIASYLDREATRIDALITAKRRLIQLLEERWRAAAESTMGDLVESHGTIPLRHLVSCLDGQRVPLSAEDRGGRQGEYPYYGASAVVDWVDDWLFDETLVLLGEDGAQLGDPTYPIAHVVTGRIWVNNHAHVLRPVAADPDFLAFHLNTFDRVAVMSGGTREKITQGDMNRIPVPNLSLTLQREVGKRLGVIHEKISATVSMLRHQSELLKEHREALVTSAVTGALDIPEEA